MRLERGAGKKGNRCYCLMGNSFLLQERSLEMDDDGSYTAMRKCLIPLSWKKKKNTTELYIQKVVKMVIFFKVGSTPSTEPNMGLELTTLRSRPELRSRVSCLTD